MGGSLQCGPCPLKPAPAQGTRGGARNTLPSAPGPPGTRGQVMITHLLGREQRPSEAQQQPSTECKIPTFCFSLMLGWLVLLFSKSALSQGLDKVCPL